MSSKELQVLVNTPIEIQDYGRTTILHISDPSVQYCTLRYKSQTDKDIGNFEKDL